MALIDRINSLATQVANYLRDSVKPKLVKEGGFNGQVLVKKSDNNLDFGWGNISDVQQGSPLNPYEDIYINRDVYVNGAIGWKDIISDINVRGSGTNSPSWTVFRNGIFGYSFSASTMQECWVQFHINHDYYPGSPIFFHTHWANSGTSTGVVRWGFEYTIAKGHQQQVFPVTQTVFVEQSCSGQYIHHVAEVPNGIVSAALEPDSLVLVRIYRDAANANDTCANPVHLFCCDMHYQTSRFATKNKAPDFYN